MTITERESALIEAFASECDRSLCPYHIKCVTEILIPGAYGPGTCGYGCIDEPECITGGGQALSAHGDLLAAYAQAVLDAEG